MLIKFYPYACWLMCCLLLAASSCTNNEAQVEEPVTQQTGVESKRHINYAVVQGDTLDIGNYKLVNVYDTFEILQIDGIDAISYDGKYGYVLNEEWESEEYIYELSVKDLKSGETIRSAWLIDIIRNSEFAEELDSYYLFNDTIDTYYIPDTLDSNSDSIKSYWIREHETFGKYYFQQSGIDQIFTSTRGIVIGSSWRYDSYKNPYSRFFIFINNDLELEYFLTIEDGDSAVDFCIIENYFQFVNSYQLVGKKHPLNIKTIESFQYDVFINIDYLTKEFFYICGSQMISGLDQTYHQMLRPRHWWELAILERKMLFFNTFSNYDLAFAILGFNSKKLAVIHSPSLLPLTEPSNIGSDRSYDFVGVSDEYIFIRSSKNYPIFAIPRKILDYAN